MACILERVFRRFASGPVSSDVVFAPHGDCNTALVGDRHSSTCVLFLAAVTAAADLGLKVLFITQTPLQTLQVSLRGSMPDLKLKALKNIKFVYAKTLEEFLEDVASLHELDSPPSLIIVDDLEPYLHGPRTGPLQDDLSTVAHVSALLHDTAAFLTHILQDRGENKGPCRFIISFHPERDGRCDSEAQAADLPLSVLERYLQVRCSLEEVTRDGEVEQKEWQVYLSASRPPTDQQNGQGQQWRFVMRSSGAVEFHPVIHGEREVPDQLENSKHKGKDVEIDNKLEN